VVDGRLDPKPITGIPDVWARGQGGMLEVALPPDHAESGWVYLAFSDPRTVDGRPAAMTAVVRGRIEGHRWVDQQEIYRAPLETYRRTSHHFGTRLAFDGQGHLFFSIGDRGARDHAQQLDRPNGKIHRLRLDGSVPPDNPFTDRPDALASIWSYGHRNPQGLDFHPATGQLYSSEHGPRGGDELNLIEKAHNYGWPVITHGMNYNGTPITDRTEAPGMEQPITHWTPSIAVIGIDFYEGDRFPQWKHDLLVSSIASGNLRRVRVDGGKLVTDELLFNDQGRLRDVASGPDGLIYVLTTEGRILRLSPQ
jgi:glucose/arabinose dehydrogenase